MLFGRRRRARAAISSNGPNACSAVLQSQAATHGNGASTSNSDGRPAAAIGSRVRFQERRFDFRFGQRGDRQVSPHDRRPTRLRTAETRGALPWAPTTKEDCSATWGPNQTDRLRHADGRQPPSLQRVLTSRSGNLSAARRRNPRAGGRCHGGRSPLPPQSRRFDRDAHTRGPPDAAPRCRVSPQVYVHARRRPGPAGGGTQARGAALWS